MNSDVDQMFDFVSGQFDFMFHCAQRFNETNRKTIGATAELVKTGQIYWNGIFKYMNEFSEPYMIAQNAFSTLEGEKAMRTPPWETVTDYLELLQFNLQVAEKGLTSSLLSMNNFHLAKMTEAFSAWLNTVFDLEGEDIEAFSTKLAQLMATVVYAYPEAIRKIEPEYGFHFDNGGYEKVAETDRFLLYQVLPLDNQKNAVKIRKEGKPIIIIPPYVLGANILSFLPGENKSYVHAYANHGIPTYIRIMKEIDSTAAVQVMTGEDDALDTRFFCEQVMARHQKAVTLNGFCQGGFIAMANFLSGELDGLVDALITCVAPLDGTRSKALVEYMNHLPLRFRDLGYAVKSLPNGNQVVDGKVMSWVYKLKSMEREAPLFTFYRDLLMFDRPNGHKVKVSKTAAAINHWLLYDRKDLPQAITKMSFDSYTIPVDKEGTLPVKLFDRKLNFKRLQEKGITLLICYGEQDDLVDKDTALAPLDFIDAEVTAFPKGHGAMATSWSVPGSECSLDSRFGDNYRGPVRFQLDLEQALDKASGKSTKGKSSSKPKNKIKN
jgi:hypothetical protein